MDIIYMDNYVTFVCRNCFRKPFVLNEEYIKLYNETHGCFCSKDCSTSFSINNKNSFIKNTKSDISFDKVNKIKNTFLKSS